MSYKLTQDANGNVVQSNVATTGITQAQLDAEAVYAAAARINPEQAQSIKDLAKGNIASPGVLVSLGKLGVVPGSDAATNIAAIDATTRSNRTASQDKLAADRAAAQGGFWNTLKRDSWSVLKGVSRGAMTVLSAPMEMLGATRSVVPLAEQTAQSLSTGAAMGIAAKATGANISAMAPKINIPSPMEQTVAGQVILNAIKNKTVKVDLGDGFLPSEDTGAGKAARDAQLTAAKVAIKDSTGKVIGYRPVSMIGDAVSTVLTGGHPDSQAGTVVSAIADMAASFAFDPTIAYASDMKALKAAQAAARAKGAFQETLKIDEKIKETEAKIAKVKDAQKAYIDTAPKINEDKIAAAQQTAKDARAAWSGRNEQLVQSTQSVKYATNKLNDALTKNQAIKDESARIAQELKDTTSVIKAPNQLKRAESEVTKATKALEEGKAMAASGQYPTWMAKVPDLEAALKTATDKAEALRATVAEGKVADPTKIEELKAALADSRLKEKYSNQEVNEMTKMVKERSRTAKIALKAQADAAQSAVRQKSSIATAVENMNNLKLTQEQRLKMIADGYEEIANLRNAGGVNSHWGYNINYDKIKDFLTGGHTTPVFDRLAEISDWKQIWRLSNKKLTPEVAQLVADAKTPEQVIDAIAPFIARDGLKGGMFAPSKIEQMGNTIAERTAMIPGVRNLKGIGAAVQTRMRQHEKVAAVFDAFTAGEKKVREITSHLYGTKVRGGAMVNIHDTAALLDSVDNFGQVVKLDKKVLDNLLDEIAKESSASNRAYKASVGLMDAVIKQYGESIPPAAQAAFKEATRIFKSSREEMSSYWASQHISGANIGYIQANGEKIILSGPHAESELLNSTVFIPPASEFLKFISKTAKYASVNKLRDVSDVLISDYWKRLQLVRPAFIIRNIAEEQLRVFGTGHISFFNNPGQAMAMWLGAKDGTAFRKFLYQMDAHRNTIFGEDFSSGDEAVDLANEMAGRAVKSDYVDMMASDVNGSFDDRSFKLLAFKNVGAVAHGSPRFFDGVANQMRIINSSEFGKVVAGYTPKFVSDAMKTGISREDAVVDYFFTGPGRAAVEKIAASQGEATSNWLKTREGLKQYLYTGTDAAGNNTSWLQRVTEMTGGHQNLKDLIAYGKVQIGDKLFKIPTSDDEAIKAIGNLKKRTMLAAKGEKARLLEAQEQFAKDIADNFGNANWDKVLVNVPSKNLSYLEAQRGLGNKINKWTDRFFEVATAFEKNSTFGPEYRQAYWDAIHEVAGALNAEAKTQLLKTAESSLKPLLFRGANYGEKHPVWKAFNVADGKGPLTLEDAHAYADNYARKHVQELFYRAGERRLIFHQLRLIGPFMNAWEDTIRQWAKIGTENPAQVYKGAKVINWLTSPESSALYQATDARDYYDPNQGFFFNDPQQGRMFFIPFAGTIMAKLAGIPSGVTYDGAPIAFSANPMSFNFALGAGSILPGVGPGVTIPISVIDSFNKGFIDNLPPDIQNWLFPFGGIDLSKGLQSVILPTNWNRILGGFTGDDSTYSNTFKPVMEYIAGGGNYNMDNPDDQAEIVAKTDKFARWFSVMRGFTGLFSPASMVAKGLAKDSTGGVTTQMALYNDFQSILKDNDGNYNSAVYDFLNLYGANAVFALISSTAGKGPTNWDAYQFVVAHPDVTTKYSDIWGFVYPGGGLSKEMYHWDLVNGKKVALNSQQILEKANNLRYYAARDALLSEVGTKLDKAGYQEAKRNLDAAFNGGPTVAFDPNKFGRQMKQMRNLIEDPRLTDAPAVTALREYLTVRDAAMQKMNKPVDAAIKGSGSDVQAARAFLTEQALWILQENPDFYKMYYEFFANELEGK